MNIDRFNLSEDERSLLIEMTDFGVTLNELLTDIRLSYPQASPDEQLALSKNLFLSVVKKGLVSLCRFTLENTKDNVYEVNESTSMTMEEIEKHISKDISWQQSSDPSGRKIEYELAPTDLGEQVLDVIFNIK
ncbi:hypothetical protein L1D59_20985 [Pseudoalteromonas piscicida]|uniref:hypothetical protein n=1 Tax=Pseudoalteromonas piscicida TaxID=43662 RepID=UPI001EFD1D4F|nr:hypothetical protein [Pseudoalteromonas piscicida]MCG9771078.1 hypothetical protein [Pseudoalteromonas piscicida]